MAINDEFKQRVWQTVHQIPVGNVISYGQIAKIIGSPNMARAVGKTLSMLPKDSQLPWHRVVNAQGKISFPEGTDRYDVQKKRLQEEGVPIIAGKVKMKDFCWNGTHS